jgi:hypothetical protein
MTKDRRNKTEPDKNKIREPKINFNTIRVFDSFEEADEFTARERASLSYDERLEHIEILRKQVFGQYLLEDDTWPPISKSFKIMKPYTNDTGKQL